MNYMCPHCKEPKTDEIREVKGTVLELVVYYGKCFVRYHRIGPVWKVVGEFCEPEYKRQMKLK